MNTSQTISQIFLASYGLVAQVFPATLAACYWRNSSKVGVFSALSLGMLTSLAIMAFPALKPFPVHEGLYGLIVNAIVLISFSLLSPDRREVADLGTDAS